MANESYTVTNQKIYFTKLALSSWQMLKDNDENNVAYLKAQQEVTIFHLYSAVWALYNEVASYYHFPFLTTPLSIKNFLTSDFIAQHPSPEMNELVSLLDEPASWLTRLVQAWQALFIPVSTKKVAANTIELKAIDDDSITFEQLSEGLNALSELIIRFRAGLTEY